VCSSDNFDICAPCFEEHGLRCINPGHTLSKHELLGLWLTASVECFEILEAYAMDGDPGFERHDLTYGNGYTSFFRTDSDLQGTSSAYIQSGDIAVIFFGSGIPFILRPHNDGFRLISGCYVPGFMNGEAIERWRAGELEQQDFAIK
jgi:hypothetical protein